MKLDRRANVRRVRGGTAPPQEQSAPYRDKVKFNDVGPYTLMKWARQGHLPEHRTAIGKTVATFVGWLKAPYEEAGVWNTLQEARLAIDVPVVVFYCACNEEEGVLGVSSDGDADSRSLLNNWRWAHNALERLIRDIHNLASGKPTKELNLVEYVNEKYGDEGKE